MNCTNESIELPLHIQDGRFYVLEYNDETGDDDDREIPCVPSSLVEAVQHLGGGVRIVAKYDQEVSYFGDFDEPPGVEVTVDLRDVHLAWFDGGKLSTSKIPTDAVKWAWDFMQSEIDEMNACGEW